MAVQPNHRDSVLVAAGGGVQPANGLDAAVSKRHARIAVCHAPRAEQGGGVNEDAVDACVRSGEVRIALLLRTRRLRDNWGS